MAIVIVGGTEVIVTLLIGLSNQDSPGQLYFLSLVSNGCSENFNY